MLSGFARSPYFLPVPSVSQLSSARNWSEIRNAYIEREIQPSLESLAAEFGPSMQKISRVSTAESWPLMRAARLEKLVDVAETSIALAHAVAGDRSIQSAAKTAALGILRGLVQLGEELGEEAGSDGAEPGKKKVGPRVRAETLNSMSFALANVSKTMRDLGITGVATKLEGIAGGKSGAGKSGAGAGWSPSMLSQINLTVQTLAAAPSTSAPAGAADASAKSASGPVLDADAQPVPVPPASSPAA